MRLRNILERHRKKIVRQWVDRLHTEISDRYSRRPLDELTLLVSEAVDANYSLFVHNDFTKIDQFIKKITRMRLDAGFTLSDLQEAFECYRTILLPILMRELQGPPLLCAIQKMNGGLNYTLIKYSDYFQSLHERQIRDHAQYLEEETEKKTKELVESEAKYRVLVEEINDGYFVNKNGTIVFANRAFCEIHGYTVMEVIGRPYTDFVAAESLNELKRIYRERMTQRKYQHLYVYYRRHKDGSSLPTENKVKLINYQGERASAGICRDITERVEMERRIHESERLAHIGQLTTSLAHEIRNPLSSVKMNIQVLLKQLHLDGNNKRRIEITAHEITRLERILEEMLDFAKPVGLHLEPVSINDIVDACLGVIDVKIKEKKILVIRMLSKKIPAILMDREKIEQAIINVLLNSIEAISDHGTIQINTKNGIKNDRPVKIEIRDNGPGVGKEELPYLFDPFFSKKKKGTGLGLTNVKKIIEAHGGVVEASLRDPSGMCLSLTIPARR